MLRRGTKAIARSCLAVSVAACVPEGPATDRDVTLPEQTIVVPAEGRADPVLRERFEDDFDRPHIGDDYLPLSDAWTTSDGWLCGEGALNRGVWLKRRLPKNVRIEFDAVSFSADGDIKVELFGDGESFDPDKGTYDPSGYVLFFGGHQNTESVIGRLGEHGEQIKGHRTDVRVEPGKWYRFKITRKGGKLDWQIDGQPFLSWTDPAPLSGKGHEFFAFNNWETDVYFDNLSIRPAN